MPLLRSLVLLRPAGQASVRSFSIGRRLFAESNDHNATSENSTPGWGGRTGDDHALNRDGLDVQSESSNKARSEKEQGTEGSGAISQKDERNANQRAKDENPEAPGPVIGMNSGILSLPIFQSLANNKAERGSKS